MANRAPKRQHAQGLIESEWQDLDRSIDDRMEDVSATVQAAEQLTAAETPEQVRERQLAAFRADQQARGVAITEAADHEQASQRSTDDPRTPLSSGPMR
jgi:hypothetical protein